MDKRWSKLARILVYYSAQVKAGEKVMIAMGELGSFELTKAIYKEVIKVGALPQVQFVSEELRHFFLKFGNSEQLSWVPEIEEHGMEWADVYFGLRGGFNLYEHDDCKVQNRALNQEAMGKISTLRWQKTRWCLVRVPTLLFAYQAKSSYEDILDMFFNSCLLDWKNAAKRWQVLADKLNQYENIRIKGHKTDLTFSNKGRNWFVFDGRYNMPDGEVATSPREDTVDGTIYFEFPGILGGQQLHDITLTWKGGKLVEYYSSNAQEFLDKIVNTDEGASKIGEFAFGLNPYIDRFCSDILLDEKIAGTLHIALGKAYTQGGGVNKSAIHWDIVKDTRQNSQVYFDDELLFENGKFTFNF